MTRKEIRNKYVTENGLSEFNINWVSGYALWLEFQLQELSKLHQPTVISAVCAQCLGEMAWSEIYQKTQCISCGCEIAN